MILDELHAIVVMDKRGRYCAGQNYKYNSTRETRQPLNKPPLPAPGQTYSGRKTLIHVVLDDQVRNILTKPSAGAATLSETTYGETSSTVTCIAMNRAKLLGISSTLN